MSRTVTAVAANTNVTTALSAVSGSGTYKSSSTLVATLRQGATFWDGTPVTAQDAAFALDRLDHAVAHQHRHLQLLHQVVADAHVGEALELALLDDLLHLQLAHLALLLKQLTLLLLELSPLGGHLLLHRGHLVLHARIERVGALAADRIHQLLALLLQLSQLTIGVGDGVAQLALSILFPAGGDHSPDGDRAFDRQAVGHGSA